MTQQFRPGDRVIVCQWSDARLTDDDHALLKAAILDPWQLPPAGDERYWRKLPLWRGCNGNQWEIIILSIDRAWAIVTSPHFPDPLRIAGVQAPLTHLELVQSSVYDQSQLDRIRSGLSLDIESDAQTKPVHSSAQSDRPPHRRQSRTGGKLCGGDRATAAVQESEAQPTLF